MASTRRSPAASACEPYREIVEQAISRGRNAVAIYQDLVSDHGFVAKYTGVGRFVSGLRGRQAPEARVVIVTEPGQEGQVDYGERPMVRDPATSKYLLHLSLAVGIRLSAFKFRRGTDDVARRCRCELAGDER